MSETLPEAEFPQEPRPVTAFRRALDALAAAAETLLQRVQAAIAHGTNPYLPTRFAKAVAKNPTRTEDRISRLNLWVEALSRVLAGDRHYLPPKPNTNVKNVKDIKDYFPLTKALRAEAGMPLPARTEYQRYLAHLLYVRKAMGSVPTNVLARRLARRLNIREDSDDWPTELLAITEPPAVWADRTYRDGKRTGPPITINWFKLAKDRAKKPKGHAPAPAFHKRE